MDKDELYKILAETPLLTPDAPAVQIKNRDEGTMAETLKAIIIKSIPIHDKSSAFRQLPCWEVSPTDVDLDRNTFDIKTSYFEDDDGNTFRITVEKIS
jgi:hypothetical protein